jgi:type II secretory pathway predicted ATPase ExeA
MDDFTGFRTRYLVARDHELKRLQQGLAAARARHGLALFVQGAMGSGKTRLCREFLRLAKEEGALCLQGSAFAVEDGLAYGMFLVALESLLHDDRTSHDAAGRLIAEFWQRS